MNIQRYFGIFVGKNVDFVSSQKRFFWNSALIRASTRGHWVRESTGNNSQRVKDHSMNLYHVAKITLEGCGTEFLIFRTSIFQFSWKGFQMRSKLLNFDWFLVKNSILSTKMSVTNVLGLVFGIETLWTTSALVLMHRNAFMWRVLSKYLFS